METYPTGHIAAQEKVASRKISNVEYWAAIIFTMALLLNACQAETECACVTEVKDADPAVTYRVTFSAENCVKGCAE